MARIIIDDKRCKQCGICIEICPKHLIAKGNVVNDAGYFYSKFEDKNGECLGCALCAENCPDMAICEVYK